MAACAGRVQLTVASSGQDTAEASTREDNSIPVPINPALTAAVGSWLAHNAALLHSLDLSHPLLSHSQLVAFLQGFEHALAGLTCLKELAVGVTLDNVWCTGEPSAMKQAWFFVPGHNGGLGGREILGLGLPQMVQISRGQGADLSLPLLHTSHCVVGAVVNASAAGGMPAGFGLRLIPALGDAVHVSVRTDTCL